jgi:membrane protein implicated in regulation of membrane protease activity
VNLAGQPSKVGGAVARVLGWLVLAGGWLVAAGLAAVAIVVAGAGSAAPWILGVPVAVLATVLAWLLLRSGKELKASGDDAEVATKNQAMFALANTRGGVLTAWDVAHALGVGHGEADALLTRLAKEHPDYVAVDIDDNGTVLYRFLTSQWNSIRARVSDAGPRMRVDDRPTAVAHDTADDGQEVEAARAVPHVR